MKHSDITVIDKQVLLMRQALDLKKKLDRVTVMFSGKPDYLLERQLDIVNQYNQVMNQLKSLVIHERLTGETLFNQLKKNV